MKGVLGLAWVAGDSAAGGICEAYKMHQNGERKSLNTGVITTINYGQQVAARVSHLTFTHEVGHNWGSPHDFPETCKPGGEKGNYIMFASATSADKPNNNRFSTCSIANMSHVLMNRRDKCFKGFNLYPSRTFLQYLNDSVAYEIYPVSILMTHSIPVEM